MTIASLIDHRCLDHPLNIRLAHFCVLEYACDAGEVERGETEEQEKVYLAWKKLKAEVSEGFEEWYDFGRCIGSSPWGTGNRERKTGRKGFFAGMGGVLMFICSILMRVISAIRRTTR